MADSLHGQLLIASPALSDYFRRTVVLVIEHTEDGAIGVVLNRPSEATVADADGSPVYVGGPVAPDAVVALGDFEDTSEAGTVVTGSLGVLDPDRPDAAVRRLRVYAGYAGWAPGQLDHELEQEAWIVEPAHPDDPFRERDLWTVALERKGGRYALLATMPEDASLN